VTTIEASKVFCREGFIVFLLQVETPRCKLESLVRSHIGAKDSLLDSGVFVCGRLDHLGSARIADALTTSASTRVREQFQ
jgi:hypothetical protein